MLASSLMQIGAGLPSGFLFGTGYGAGVRFGYEEVYPYLKGNMSQITNMLNIPYASSGFKLASGVTEAQGKLSKVPPNQNSPVGNLQAPSPRGAGNIQAIETRDPSTSIRNYYQGQRVLFVDPNEHRNRGKYHLLGTIMERSSEGWKPIGNSMGFSLKDLNISSS